MVLAWETRDASSVSLTNADTVADVAPTGSRTVALTADGAFSLRAHGPTGVLERELKVDVGTLRVGGRVIHPDGSPAPRMELVVDGATKAVSGDDGSFVFEEVFLDGPGVVTLVVKPTVWLDQIDFEGVAESDDGAPVDLEPESQAQRGFTRGIKKGTAYALSFAPGSPEEKE